MKAAILTILLFLALMPVPRAQQASAGSSLAKRIAQHGSVQFPSVSRRARWRRTPRLRRAADRRRAGYPFLLPAPRAIPPKSGIGAHFHNQCEEMFVILDGEAQFTIDGRTSLLKGPGGAPCRMGHSHGIYNATTKPVQWMNINVTAMKGAYDAFNLDDARVDVALDPIRHS